MRTIFRHIGMAIFNGILILIVTAGVLVVEFDLNWQVLFTHDMKGVPLAVILVVVPVLIGIIIGIIMGAYHIQRRRRMTQQLKRLANGETLKHDVTHEYDLNGIQKQLEQIQTKIRHQTELNQRMATDRAMEREQSLQEIVLQERSRLARELHDSVSQELFAVSMMMSTLSETVPSSDEALQKQLRTVEQMINQAQLEMRALLLHLRPVALKGKTLQEGTQDLLNELLQKVPLSIDWKVESFAVEKGIEDQLFRILQESVSNTLRHAKAKTLHVLLIKRDGHIILRMTDDGIGFDMQEDKTGSYGLDTMRERAYEIGGDFKLVSLPNQGTNLEVKIPVLESEEEDHD